MVPLTDRLAPLTSLCVSLSLTQLPGIVKRTDIDGAEKWPRSRGHVQDTNVQVCGQLLQRCLSSLQCPDLSQHARSLPARE